MALSEYVATDDPIYSPSALAAVAMEVAMMSGVAWTQIAPQSLRVVFVLELGAVGQLANGGGSLRRSREIVQRTLVWESHCTPKRNWTDATGQGLVDDVQDWLANVAAKHSPAYVEGFRTHLSV